jgi:MYXO-CTERM domain-containing protein
VNAAGYYGTTRFSGALGASELASSPALAKLAAPGERLVKMDVQFYPSETTTDLALVPGSVPDFRETVYDITYVDCDGGTLPGDAGASVEVSGGGCAVGGGGSSGAMAVAVVSLVGLLARRRRRSQGTPG